MNTPSPTPSTDLPSCDAPTRDCPLCPRLAALRETLRAEEPDGHNAPVGSYGQADAPIAIVGTAPTRLGGNRTGLAFTGDRAGRLLANTLDKFEMVDEAGEPSGVLLLTALRCALPGNKPEASELQACRQFLEADLKAPVVVALGAIAHQSAVKAMGGKLPKYRYAPLAEHKMPNGQILIDGVDNYNYNRRNSAETAEALEAVIARAVEVRG